MKLRINVRALIVSAAAFALYAQPIAAQDRWSVDAVASAEDLTEPGDLYVETRSIRAAAGTEITADFGRLVVPENRARSDSDPIQIAFVRLRGPADRVRAPLIYLAGGPGGSSTWQAEEPDFLDDWVDLLADGDVILLDQRGTGGSSPRLLPRHRPGGPAGAGLVRARLAGDRVGAARGIRSERF